MPKNCFLRPVEMQTHVKFSTPMHLTHWDTDTYPKEIGQVIVYEIEVDELNYQTYYLHNQNAKDANKDWI